MLRVLSVDLGTRNLAWFTGIVQTNDAIASAVDSASACASGIALATDENQSPPLIRVPLSFVKSVRTESWEVVDIVPPECTESLNSMRVEEFVPWLCAAFEVHKASMLYDRSGSPVEIVFLEQQPLGTGEAAARNIKTKVLSHVLQALIIHELGSVIPIYFISPKKKLRHATLVLGHAPTSYAENKKAAKLLAPILLEQLGDDDTSKTFRKRKGKKDDLADAMLQAVYSVHDIFQEREVQRLKQRKREDREAREARKACEAREDRKRDAPDEEAAVGAAVGAAEEGNEGGGGGGSKRQREPRKPKPRKKTKTTAEVAALQAGIV